MEYERGEEIILDNDKSYIIIDNFKLKDKEYLFLISEEKDTALVQIEDNTLKTIESDSEYNEVFTMVIEKNKEEVTKILNE